MSGQPSWQQVAGNWVLLPRHPRAVVHFLGGAFIGGAPQITYHRLLESLSQQGYAIIATPFETVVDHFGVVHAISTKFAATQAQLHETNRLKRFLPVYGLGHSMGCKLHLMLGSLYKIERAGNVLISFNNERAEQAIPFAEFLSPNAPVRFDPPPAETELLVQAHYQVRRNLLVKFKNDTLDQTLKLAETLEQRFPGMISTQRLAGNHLTPMGPDLNWKSGDVFTPFDAVGQWIRQGVYRELEQLEQTILRWLDPLGGR
ncbi:MAG: DUF1350 family protein [Thermosynechococcaceae cyanobacterium]